MCGCKEQKYSYVPGVVNVNENLPAVSSAFDLKSLLLEAMVCGTSSSLAQVTVVPAFTVMRCGVKVNWSMSTSASVAGADAAGKAAAAATRSTTPNAVATRLLDLIVRMTETPTSPLQRLVDDGKPLLSAFEGDVGDAENRAQLVVGDFHRTRRGSRARRGLREGGRHGGVEGGVAFDLLHDLVDVTVERRHRSEVLEGAERTRRVVRPPA